MWRRIMDEIRINDWSDLPDCIEANEKAAGHRWLFRGVAKSEYGLVPKIGRPDARKNPADGQPLSHSQEEEIRALETFKRTARPFLEFGTEVRSGVACYRAALWSANENSRLD